MSDRSDNPRPVNHALHDVDLVAAYASSVVDDVVDERRVAEWLDQCEVCQTEFDVQNQVAAFLSRSVAAPMTDAERRRLQTGVLASLDEAAVGAKVIDLSARRQRRWLATASVAAVSLVAIIGVGSLLSGGLGDAGSELAAGDQATESTFLNPGAELKLEPEVAAESASAAAEGDVTAADEATQEDGEDAAGAAEMAAPPPPEALRENLADPQTRESLLAYLDARMEALSSEDFLVPIDPEALSATESPAPPCLTSDLGNVYLVVETVLEGDAVIAFVTDPTDTPTARGELEAQVFDAVTCAPVDL